MSNPQTSPQFHSQNRPPTMADVARRAGVSHQTVSRVLNNHPSVRPDTRARVLKAIEELGYRPNAAARGLRTQRTQMFGFLSDHIATSPFDVSPLDLPPLGCINVHASLLPRYRGAAPIAAAI